MLQTWPPQSAVVVQPFVLLQKPGEAPQLTVPSSQQPLAHWASEVQTLQ
jgi:hypothetical protein